MSKEQQGLLDEAYENYVNKTKFPGGDTVPKIEFMYPDSTILSQEEFINKCKTNNEFSKKWGLKIEEKVLDLNERQSWFFENKRMFLNNEFCDEVESHKNFDYYNIPKKLITLTYNNEILESYE
jgi:hypothetical protein